MIKRICKTCGEEKLVTRAMKFHKGNGNCKSCALKNNQRRLLKYYDVRKLYNSPIYKSWQNMKTRCTNKKANNYYRYGGRKITYSKDWETFAGFFKDMGSSYKQGLTLERINNDGNYCKENCRWATHKEQANNRKTNTLITINNITKTFAQWCALSGAKPSTIRQRYYAYGWTIEDALSI